MIFYYAVSLAMRPEDIAAAVREDEFEFSAVDAVGDEETAVRSRQDGPRPEGTAT